MRPVAFVSLVFATALPASAAVPPGTYIGNQTELAAQIVLQPDGRFQYALSYGALNEQARGRWVERDGNVLLTTEPAPKPPAFPIVSDTPSPDAKLYASLSDPEALGGFSLTLRLTYEGEAQPDFVEAGENGLVPVPAGKQVRTIVPDLPVYSVSVAAHSLAPGGHRLVFRFEPNDLGIADFRAEPLVIQQGALIMQRHDRVIRFQKENN